MEVILAPKLLKNASGFQHSNLIGWINVIAMQCVLGALAHSLYIPIAITNVWGVHYQESRFKFDQLPLPCNCAFKKFCMIPNPRLIGTAVL